MSKLQTLNSTNQAEPTTIEIAGQRGVRVTVAGSRRVLELRQRLGLGREVFGRLVNISTRALAEVESKGLRVEKLERNYLQLSRLIDALSEVIDVNSIGQWLTQANPAFSNSRPLELIERGEIDRIWEMIYRLRSGAPV